MAGWIPQIIGRLVRAKTVVAVCGTTLFLQPALWHAAGPTASDYLVYVVCESADKIALVRFSPGRGARVEREIATGAMVPDIDGPHGIVVSPDKQFYYVSLGHGRPFGSVWKYSTKNDAVVGRVTLGMFPATMDISRDGNLLYVVNFNLHGDMTPSSVSVVATEVMVEVARIPTCTMPHGSRITLDGSRHYSACMMDDLLVEIDPASLRASRRFAITAEKDKNSKSAPAGEGHMGHGSCSPTWAQPSVDGGSVYVACNKSDEIVEIDSRKWAVKRRISARAGVYNLAVTKDNRLVATNKRDQSVSVIDLASGRELARIPTRRRVVHGVVVSPDDRYAFVSVEGVGSEPGSVEVIDLQRLSTVAAVDVSQQAAGIDFFKTEPQK
jgi:DNA-binding beta-propeller fold protein YncE